jgi:uncharacterized lipoprotein YehR (DUF1307 family)
MKYIFIAVAAIILALWLCGCSHEKQAQKFFAEHPDKLADKCAAIFPVHDSTIVRDSVRFDTLYMEGVPVILRDSFYIKGDTIIKQVIKQCPQSQIITKYVNRDSIIYRRDGAAEAVLNFHVSRLQADSIRKLQTIEGLTSKVGGKNKLIWLLLAVVILESLWIFRKPLLSIINPVKILPPL